jgi:hypothetical protein
MFFFKRNKIHLDCFTPFKHVYEYTPIEKATKFLPDWWKKTEKGGTIKTCSGIIDFHKESISLNMWCDLSVSMSFFEPQKFPTNRCIFSDKVTVATLHDRKQYSHFIDAEYTHMKINSPWAFKTKENINWVWVSNTWQKNLNDNFTVLNGVVNYHHVSATHVNIIIKCEKNKTKDFIIEHNTPLVNIFPMSEKEVVIHNHLIDEKKFAEMITFRQLKFNNSYPYQVKLKEKSGCPFHR